MQRPFPLVSRSVPIDRTRVLALDLISFGETDWRPFTVTPHPTISGFQLVEDLPNALTILRRTLDSSSTLGRYTHYLYQIYVPNDD